MIGILAASLAVLAGSAVAQVTPAPQATPFTPLASKRFQYTALPYQADTGTGERGTQSGYNICNSTTEGPTSKCQTAVINSLDDFCLWGPQEPDGLIGDVEGEAVAWCTKPGRGTRLIPQGALTGVQFMRTPAYVQVTGRINQALINIKSDDSGGEMDPHGADQRGNPLGGLLFSNAWGGGGNNFQQVLEWHNFMGENLFCLKACDPAGADDDRYCEHIFDRIGCWHNAPAAYVDGVFESCLGDNQDFPGIYTGADGQITTYRQPPESLGPITTMPYNPKIPASSSCTPFQSAAIYTGLPAPSGPVPQVGSSSAVSSASSAVVSSRLPVASAASRSSASTSATASGAESAAGPAMLTSGAIWSIAVGVVGAAIGAAVAL